VIAVLLAVAVAVHRFIMRRPSAEGVAEKTEVVVIPTRAARRSDELHEGAI
jgi:hypothetical protein